ncbi:MAG TPA: FtsX-like permease family protein, partial [Puia sp.]|nr:FtsX-like permease family protein [Puia sp.]
KNGQLSGGRIQYIRLFTLIGVFILLIACINFMNLTTARSIKRAKEIGIRKVVGAVRLSLIRQFIGEAMLVAWIATLISLCLVSLILPAFNMLTGKNIHIPFHDPVFWFSIAGLLAITGIISGSYPAFYLSSFKPVRVLKTSLRFSGSFLWFRKGLVIFQFVLSIVLIIGTIVVSRQVSYVQNTNLGYDRENLIYIPVEGDLGSKFGVFKNAVRQMPGINGVTRMSDAPTQIENGTGGVDWEGKNPDADISFSYAGVGYDFTKTMHLKIKEGRDFSSDFASDSVGYMVNESALKLIGYKDPVGKPLTFWGKKGTIVGVLKDFHFTSLHDPINPLILTLGENINFGSVLIRAQPGKIKEALTSLESVCKSLNPKFPFTFKFSDEEYQKLYVSEQVVKQLADYFAGLAIFISCLGLLGLVMFTAEQRTKEFGIRKALGASSFNLFNLLSKEYLGLVTIALLIASPIAWLVMNNWLQDYAYRVDISWWIFMVAGAATILIALVTVSFQSIKAATANPVKSLRTE